MDAITYKPIGVIRTPFTDVENMPVQPSGGTGIAGRVELNLELADGLKDVEGFSHLMLIYHFHLSKPYSLLVKPFLDDTVRGVFATRAPMRPNPIGVSVVKLTKIEGCILHVENVDILDGTPLLDIKPYVSDFNNVQDERSGWLTERTKKARMHRSDGRFR